MIPGKIHVLQKYLLLVVLLAGVLTGASLAEEAKSDIAKSMQQIENAFEELKTTVSNDAEKAENLQRIDALIQGAHLALALEPPGSDKMEGERKAQFVEQYRSALRDMLADAKVLRTMVEEDVAGDARYEQLMKVYNHQARGHGQYREKTE